MTPEDILLRMRTMGSVVYSAGWDTDDGRTFAACVIVDEPALARRLLDTVREWTEIRESRTWIEES